MNAPLISKFPAQAQPARFSTAEFLEMIEHDIFGDRKVELVAGEIIELPQPGKLHARLQAQLILLLATVAQAIGDLEAVGEVGIELFDGTVRACDAALLHPSSGEKLVQPDEMALAVEISVTTLPNDLGPKADGYALAGIAAVWIVDPESAIVHVRANPVDGDYKHKEVVRFGEPLSVPGTDQTIVITRR